MGKINKFVKLILSMPKTVFFNFKVFDFKTAIKLPVLIGYDTKIGALKGSLILNHKPSLFMIKFNWGGTESRLKTSGGFFLLGEDAELKFNGKAYFSEGISLSVEHGKMEVGDSFFCNRNCAISCNDRLSIGHNVMLGWNIEILDSDNHEIKVDGVIKKDRLPIQIGNKVWIGAYVSLLKGTVIPDGCIVAYNSFLNKQFCDEKVIIGGNPARILKRNVEWSSKTIGKENR